MTTMTWERRLVVHVDGWELLVRESKAFESVLRIGRV